MSSSKTVSNLNIRKFPSYDSYKNATVGEDDLCVVDEGGRPAIQVANLPTASANWVGRIVQETSSGYFYKCVAQGTTPETYAWGWQDVQYVAPAVEQMEYLVIDPSKVGRIIQYIGTTTAEYTNGYFYKQVHNNATATASQTTGSSLSDITVDVTAFETFPEVIGIGSGSYPFEFDGSDWYYGGTIYDPTTYGITFTGTPVANDVITVVYTVASDDFVQTDVQPTPVIPDPLPSQTGNSGKFLTTDGTDASWSDKPLVNQGITSEALMIAPNAFTVAVTGNSTFLNTGIYNPSAFSVDGAVSIGGSYMYSQKPANYTVGINGKPLSAYSIAINGNIGTNSGNGIGIGGSVSNNAQYAIQFGYGTNSDANTFKVANANGNFEIMNANGNLPADRLASTSGLADGNYRLRLVIASVVPTLEWVAE